MKYLLWHFVALQLCTQVAWRLYRAFPGYSGSRMRIKECLHHAVDAVDWKKEKVKVVVPDDWPDTKKGGECD